MTTGQMYNIYTRSGLTTPDSNVYTGWEADKTAMCVCDMGRTGASCEMKMCPKGNDPLTETTGYKAIRIDTISAASPSTLTGGTFRVIFNDQSFTFDADIDNWDAATCEAKFESLHNIGTVQCIEGIMSGNSKNMTVKFLTWPTIPYENNIFTNDGSSSAGEFRCDTSQVDSSGGFVGCSITDVTNSTAILPEYEYCSRRGGKPLLTNTHVHEITNSFIQYATLKLVSASVRLVLQALTAIHYPLIMRTPTSLCPVTSCLSMLRMPSTVILYWY